VAKIPLRYVRPAIRSAVAAKEGDYNEKDVTPKPRRRGTGIGWLKMPPIKRYRSTRGVMTEIRRAATFRVKLRIWYDKLTTGESVMRLVEPYSFRFKNTRLGRRKVLYGYHGRKRTIKMFVLNNIKGAERTRQTFEPRWRIEIPRLRK